MLKSALIGKEYNYEEMNLLELRNKIIEQENLSPTDILCMYNEINNQRVGYGNNYPIAYLLTEEEKRKPFWKLYFTCSHE